MFQALRQVQAPSVGDKRKIDWRPGPFVPWKILRPAFAICRIAADSARQERMTSSNVRPLLVVSATPRSSQRFWRRGRYLLLRPKVHRLFRLHRDDLHDRGDTTRQSEPRAVAMSLIHKTLYEAKDFAWGRCPILFDTPAGPDEVLCNRLPPGGYARHAACQSAGRATKRASRHTKMPTTRFTMRRPLSRTLSSCCRE